MKIISVFGTRPEALKMAPLVKKISSQKCFKSICAVSAQHREMLDQVLEFFGIKPDYDLNIMTAAQSLHSIAARSLEGFEKIFKKEKPSLILVHGDTTTTLAAALAGHYSKIPVGHIEAGLRSGDPFNPFPEENNRRLTDALSSLHFAPTAQNRKNLIKENIKRESIFVSGNTIIDALLETAAKVGNPKNGYLKKIIGSEKIVLVTAHRRENLGRPLENICRAVKELSEKFPRVLFVYPLHMNPAVRKTASRFLGGEKNIFLTKPLSYPDMVWLLKKTYLCLSDSGGLQEEAPALGIPVLVLRKVTERPEGLSRGPVRLAGVHTEKIVREAEKLLEDRNLYSRLSRLSNPYGEGEASRRICGFLKYRFGFSKIRPPEWEG